MELDGTARLEARDDRIRGLSRDDPRAARMEAERWLASARAAGLPIEEAWARRALAHCQRSVGDLAEAVAGYEAAEALFGNLGDRLEQARTGLGHVWALRLLGRYDEAVRLGRRTQRALYELGDPFRAASQGINLGTVFRRQGHLKAAARAYRATLAALRRLHGDGREPPPRVAEYEATCQSNLGNVLAELGQYAQAERAQLSAERIYARLGQRAQLGRALMNVGLVRVRRGDYGAALTSLQQARELFETLELRTELAQVDLDLTRALLELNLVGEATETCDRAIVSLRSLDLPYELGQALLWSAHLAQRAGRVAAAREAAGEAATVFERLGNRLWAALARGRALALAAEDASPANLAEVKAGLAAVHAALDELGAREEALRLRLQEAEIEERSGARERAAAIYQEAAVEERGLRSDLLTYGVHARLGAVLERQDPPRALVSYLRAIGAFERMRTRARADDLKLAFGESRVDVYERAIRLVLDSGEPERVAGEALSLVERSKSRGLVEELLDRVSPNEPRYRPLVRRVRELRAALNAAYAESYASDRPPEQEDLARSTRAERTRSLVRELEQATRALQLAARGGQGVAGATFDWRDLQSRLPADAALVAYYAIGQELLAFVVGPHRLVVHRALATVSDVEWQAERLRFQLGKSAYGARYLLDNLAELRRAVDRPLRELWCLLIEPLWSEVAPAQRLLVIPHGALHGLPFHALFDGERYLVERAEVVTAPSATLYLLSAAAERGPIERPLFVGPDDPTIPWARREVAALARLFPRGAALRGQRATIAAFQRHARRSDALHLATHGVFRTDNPAFSSLKLADGWLSVADLREASRDASLVTLSACETGVTEVRAGDELLGLSRAVLGAGAASLVASLWPVHDESAAALMTAFYAGLKVGRGKAESLRAAMLAQRVRTDHPYFWAPFALVGAP